MSSPRNSARRLAVEIDVDLRRQKELSAAVDELVVKI
jgi:hypothetical protein